MLTANEIRQQFIDFFVQKHGHTFVPSSPVVPFDDPTLLFTNAGMNQFKDVFLATGKRDYQRAVNSQKCIRAGGKHNDLDDVGKDTYHHTFFEMLGNWSFGDYFKKEAISWAWELLTKVWGLDKSRLHATVFEGDSAQGLARDDEAAEYWRTMTDIDPAHIHLGNKKDNFWEMGETGPCGPCTEIHYDRTPDKSGGKLVNAGSADVIEIWNLVFIQFNRNPDRSLSPLPAQHVDTGMGFERVTAVIQGKASNYDTDVFSPLMDAIGALTGKKYGGQLTDINDIAFRVIADHLRMLSFAIADGGQFGNKKRGAVMRSVLRRAVRYGWQVFALREPFLFKLVPALVEHMGHAFKELMFKSDHVIHLIRGEESDFLRTIERGIDLYGKEAKKAQQGNGVISGKAVFDLYTTYGFPPDLTRQMAAEQQMIIDEVEFKRQWDIHVTTSGLSSEGDDGESLPLHLPVVGELPPTADEPKWSGRRDQGKVLGWVASTAEKSTVVKAGALNTDEHGWLLLDQTCFYAEQGGQVGDRGTVVTASGTFTVTQTEKVGGAVLHGGAVTQGKIEVGQTAKLEVDAQREFTRKNHTATHLLNWALRRVLGDHIDQKGSLVDPDKTRFDFSHPEPITAEQIAEIERLVNEKIYSDLPVKPIVMPLAKAKEIHGVRAVFGEKYPDPVRVLLIGAEKPEDANAEVSVEFCGGTHLDRTSQAGFFKIVGQEAVGKGVRRLTAVTGREAVNTVQKLAGVVGALTAHFRCQPDDLPTRIESMEAEIKKLQAQLKKGATADLQGKADELFGKAIDIRGSKLIIGTLPGAPAEQVRSQMDRLRQRAGSSLIILLWVFDEKPQVLVSVTSDLTAKGIRAGDIIKDVAAMVGGKGGGKPELAQAGGKDASKIEEAIEVATRVAHEQLAKVA